MEKFETATIAMKEKAPKRKLKSCNDFYVVDKQGGKWAARKTF